MAIERRALVQEILKQCSEIDERVPGYREELRDTVIDIISSEADHEKQRVDIVVKVTQFCKRLGEYAANHDSSRSATLVEDEVNLQGELV